MAFRSLYLSQCDQKKDKGGALTNPQMIVLNVLSKLVFQTLFYLKIGNLCHLKKKKKSIYFFMSQSDDAFQCMSNCKAKLTDLLLEELCCQEERGKNTFYHISVMIKLLLWKHLCFGSPSTIIRFKLQIKLNKVLKFRSCVLCKMLKP